MPPSSIEHNDPLEDGLLKGSVSDSGRNSDDPAIEDGGDTLVDADWRRMFKDALRSSDQYMQQSLRSAWSRNYRAFNSRHPNGTKYETRKYRTRSKLFKPKTRMAVRKNDAAAASAMFATSDVVSITAQRSSDPVQRMGARFIHSCLNYRLDTEGPMTGPNWFMTAIGARQDAQIAGVCYSKQFWEHETKFVPEFVPAMDVNGMPEMDADGVPLDTVEDVSKVVKDRMMILNIPPEHAFIDPAGDWRNPIQDGGFAIFAHPTRQEDLETMMLDSANRPSIGGGAWRTDIDVGRAISAGKAQEASRKGQAVRASRDDTGVDKYESKLASGDSDTIWLYECFYRFGSEDWHWWMLGETIMLSDPRPTEESYPEQKGMRPYVRGVGALETHRTHPTAPVEQWNSLQQEMNEITNLDLDARKMAISPITKVVRGRNIDLKQVQNRGPDAYIMVDKMDDVDFAIAPGGDAKATMAVNQLSVDFDELAGVFSTGSVQSNRQLNETVGGMNLMSQSSNSLTEFDLRVWAETWLEPVIRQCANLIAFYENDETAMAIAGENAGLIVGNGPKPPQNKTLDQQQAPQGEPPIHLDMVLDVIDEMPVAVKVNIGIGAMDSKQKLEKFMVGSKSTMEMAPLLKAAGIKPKATEMLNEVWGLIGYKDADRFYEKDEGNDAPPPEVQEAQAKMKMAADKHKQEMEKGQQEMAFAKEEHAMKMQDSMAKAQQQREDTAFAGEQEVAKQKGDADAKRIEAGLPGDQTFQAMLTMMQQRDEQMAARMEQRDQAFMATLAQLAEAIGAPREVALPDGRVFKSQKAAPQQVQ